MFEHNDRYLGVGITLIGAYCLYLSHMLSLKSSSDPAGAGAVPTILSVIFIVVGVILTAGSVLGGKKDAVQRTQEEKAAEKSNLLTVAVLAGICLAYIILLPYVSYLIATPCLIAGILYVLGERRPKTVILLSVLVTLVLFVMFYYVLQVRLPLGFLREPLRGIGLAR